MQNEWKASFGPFCLDMADARLWRGAEEIRLRPQALALLQYLIEHRDRVVPKRELLATLWSDVAVSDAVVKVAVREIRAALGYRADDASAIHTVRHEGYRFVASVTEARSGPAGPAPHDAGRFVGREGELGVLEARLHQAEQRARQIVFVTGEPGIGKTTLVDTFVRRSRLDERMWAARGQCLERHGAGEAYLPLLEIIGRLGRGPGGRAIVDCLRQYAPAWLVQLPALVGDAEVATLRRRALRTTHECMLREMAEAIEAFTQDRGLLLILEDLQWSDYSTLELVSYLAHRREPARLMLLGTYRPVDATVHQPQLPAMKRELVAHGQCTEVALDALSSEEVEKFVCTETNVDGDLEDLSRVVYRRTEGNPLFMVNLLDFMLNERLVVGGAVDLENRLPETLRGMVEKQLDGVDDDAGEVLEVGSAAGAIFASALVAAAIRQARDDVEEACEPLVARRQLLSSDRAEEWPDGTLSATYRFRHGLYRQVLYERMGAGHRVRVHRLLGLRKERGFGDRATEIAGELALHFELGHDSARACRYHRIAGETALGRSGYCEARVHFERAIELRRADSEDAPDSQDALLQILLGRVLIALRGPAAPETRQAYARACELCTRIGDPTYLFPALYGNWACAQLRGELPAAREFGVQMLAEAERLTQPSRVAQAHAALATTLLFSGELRAARDHVEQSLACPDVGEPDDLALVYAMDRACHAQVIQAMCLWLAGYPERAVQTMKHALAGAADYSVFAQCLALNRVAILAEWQEDWDTEKACAEATSTLARDHGIVQFLTEAAFLNGSVMCRQGDTAAGLAEMQQGMDAFHSQGVHIVETYFLALLAEGYRRAGRPAEALRTLDEALASVVDHGERFFEADLWRRKGELLQEHPRMKRIVRTSPEDAPDTEACFRRAVAVARSQGARSLELRAATSLAALLHERGDSVTARQVLAPVYGQFDEGGDMPDLRRASDLLDTCAG